MSAGEQLPSTRSTLAADLAALAAEPTSEKRLELLRRITDAYVAHADQCTPAEQYLFNEVVTQLVDRIDSAGRALAATKLSQLAKLPHGVAERFANDSDIAVARPIIHDYRGLSERTLIDVAKTGSQAHLNVIAGRATVTPPVSDVVVTRGDREAVMTLAANRGAQFSDFGMDKLIDKAGGDGDLQALVVARADLSLVAIGRLLPVISDELAGRLRDVSVNIDDAAVERHLNDWAIDRQKNVARTDAYIEGIRKGDLNTDDIILELVTRKRLLDAATVLAAILDLDRYYTFNLLTGGNIESALLLLRAVGLSWLVADAFVKLRIAKAGLFDHEALPDRQDYFAIDVAAAQRVVRFMKVRRAVKVG
jgi:hypothetical protein